MYKLTLATLLILFCSTAQAYNEPSIGEFFAIENNQIYFNKLSESGAINKVRDQMVSICKTWSKGKSNVDKGCECASKELSKFSDRELFYASTLAYSRYQAKLQALRNKDNARFEALKTQFNNSPLAPEEIEQKCENI